MFEPKCLCCDTPFHGGLIQCRNYVLTECFIDLLPTAAELIILIECLGDITHREKQFLADHRGRSAFRQPTQEQLPLIFRE